MLRIGLADLDLHLSFASPWLGRGQPPSRASAGNRPLSKVSPAGPRPYKAKHFQVPLVTVRRVLQSVPIFGWIVPNFQRESFCVGSATAQPRNTQASSPKQHFPSKKQEEVSFDWLARREVEGASLVELGPAEIHLPKSVYSIAEMDFPQQINSPSALLKRRLDWTPLRRVCL